jgi:hypothetical protein
MILAATGAPVRYTLRLRAGIISACDRKQQSAGSVGFGFAPEHNAALTLRVLEEGAAAKDDLLHGEEPSGTTSSCLVPNRGVRSPWLARRVFASTCHVAALIRGAGSCLFYAAAACNDCHTAWWHFTAREPRAGGGRRPTR